MSIILNEEQLKRFNSIYHENAEHIILRMDKKQAIINVERVIDINLSEIEIVLE